MKTLKFRNFLPFSLLLGFTPLLGVNQFLQNSGIVDIGRKTTSTEIEVPKEYVYHEPSLNIVPNIVIYNERLQSELFSCETDFLGTETCPSGRSDCSSLEEFDNGYSTKHTTIKNFAKICPLNTVQINEECFDDKNNDGVPDNSCTKDNAVWDSSRGKCINKAASGGLTGSGFKNNDSQYLKITKYNAIVGATYCNWGGSHGLTGVVFYNSTGGPVDYGMYYNPTNQGMYIPKEVYDNNGVLRDKSKLVYTSWKDNYALALPGTINLSSVVNNEATKCNNTNPYGRYIVETESELLNGYHDPFCEAGFTSQGQNCKINAQCPLNTMPQPDGSCKMTYDWYSYHCPTDTTYYQATWQVRDTGSDCGNPTCTNGPTPPLNNCVRVNYSCPIDSNLKCAKATKETTTCDVGYIWNDNRCERIESYCGSSIYNSILDICQNFTYYTKPCNNPTDTYNSINNRCESNTKICEFGTYNTLLNTCVMDFVGSCSSSGFIYDPITESCTNPNKPICDNPQYHYDVASNSCVGEMQFCEAGFTLNEQTLKCEKTKCGLYGTIDSGTRCETSSQCVGTITNQGTCIPNTIQQ